LLLVEEAKTWSVNLSEREKDGLFILDVISFPARFIYALLVEEAHEE